MSSIDSLQREFKNLQGILDPLPILLTDQELSEKDACTRSVRAFFENSWHAISGDQFIGGWHIDCLLDHLDAVAQGQLSRLLVTIPPATGKSNLITAAFPAYLWATDPQIDDPTWQYATAKGQIRGPGAKIGAISYGQSLERQARQIFTAHYFLAVVSAPFPSHCLTG